MYLWTCQIILTQGPFAWLYKPGKEMCCFHVSFIFFRTYIFTPATDWVLSTQQCRWSVRDNICPIVHHFRRCFIWMRTRNRSRVTDGELYLSESLVQADLESIILLYWGSLAWIQILSKAWLPNIPPLSDCWKQCSSGNKMN